MTLFYSTNAESWVDEEEWMRIVALERSVGKMAVWARYRPQHVPLTARQADAGTCCCWSVELHFAAVQRYYE